MGTAPGKTTGRPYAAAYSWTARCDPGDVAAAIRDAIAGAAGRVIVLRPPAGHTAAAVFEYLEQHAAPPSASGPDIPPIIHRFDGPGLDALVAADAAARPGDLVLAGDCPPGAAAILPDKIAPDGPRLVLEVLDRPTQPAAGAGEGEGDAEGDRG